MDTTKIGILIVDDEERNCLIFEDVLNSNRNHQISLATSGKIALETLENESIDIILMDIEMPGMDGFEVCRRIRQNHDWSGIKIILMSARRTSVEDKVHGLRLNADDFILKPMDFQELNARIQVFTRLIQKERQLHMINRELEAKNDELQKQAEIGGLVAAVVHDAKKFTVAMTMGLRDLIIPILQEKLSHEDEWVLELMNDLNDAVFNGEQCTEFLGSLLAIHRNEEVEITNVVTMVQKALSLLSYNLQKDKIEWSMKFDPNEQYLTMGNSQLIRVFMNLIANAHDALKRFEVSTPLITIRIEKLAEDLKVTVSDNGPGIKTEILESIRKGIAVSTKGKGGNGLGVSGASKILKSLQGRLEVTSQLGKGADFIVYLPKLPASEEKAKPDPLKNVDFF